MEWLTTSTILRDLRQSDDGECWTRLIERFRRPIVNFGRKVGLSAADAEDAAQEALAAFVRSYRAGQYDRNRGRLGDWLFGIAFRQFRRVRRQSARQGSIASNAADLHHRTPPALEASRLWEREWESAILAECIRRVRREVEPQTFRVFELIVLERRTPAQTAEALSLPPTVVYNAKHRVISRMRKWRSMLEEIV